MPDLSPTSIDARWVAVCRRDPAADDRFVYSVATTGVFCRPSCAARLPRPENVVFHADAVAAIRAGFRPCKRCRPDLPARAEREATLITAACRRIEAAEVPPTLAELAAAAGLSAHHFHRLFRRVVGLTPKAYAEAERQRRVRAGLERKASVTETLYAAGFGSSGRFYSAAPALLGMTPGAYRAGGVGERIVYAVGVCTLGSVLAAATERGLCAILLGDAVPALVDALQRRFPGARSEPAGPDFAVALATVVRLVDDPAGAPAPALPLDIRGTVFQRQVWQALQAIPPGTTVTYAELARRVGRPRAVRAVAGACAANRLAVAVPCHRVVATSGDLAGYRWGVARKQALIERERTGVALSASAEDSSGTPRPRRAS